jgi:hypothetical protein
MPYGHTADEFADLDPAAPVSPGKRTIVRVWAVVPLAAVLAALGWAGFAPLDVPSRDELFEIPKGTYARRMAGDKVEILPSRIRLTLGLNDVLLLRNLDDVPQVFGPTIMMPGQSPAAIRKPPECQFACTAHASGQMTTCEPNPDAVVEDSLAPREWWRTGAMKGLKQALPSIIVIAVVVRWAVVVATGAQFSALAVITGTWSWRAMALVG